MTQQLTARAPEVDLDDLLLRMIERGNGVLGVPVVQQALVELIDAAHGDEESLELATLLTHLRETGQTEAAEWTAAAAADLETIGRPLTAEAHHPFWYAGAPLLEEKLPGEADTDSPRILTRERIAPPRYTDGNPEVIRSVAIDDEALSAEIGAINWFHTIDFGSGLTSPGHKARHIVCAEADTIFRVDIAGKSVLDIGAWDGFFSLEAHRRGAARVLATDWFCWGGPGPGTKHGFNLVRRILAPEIEEKEIDVPELSPQSVGKFDVVLFLGVLYHVRHPLLELERVAEITRELLVLETHLDATEVERPAMIFFPGRELNDDPTNWWGPNVPCVVEMLRTVGFREIYFSSAVPGRGIFHAFK
jgi:tRNA (mo5U34)-methyltransferase